jgi:hypothetical protein
MKTKFILYVLLLAIVSIARCSNLEEEAVTDRHLEKGNSTALNGTGRLMNKRLLPQTGASVQKSSGPQPDRGVFGVVQSAGTGSSRKSCADALLDRGNEP